MATELYPFQITIPLGTPKATPQISNLAMPAKLVKKVTIRIPPGPRGEVGISIGQAGTGIFPAQSPAVSNANSSQWLVDDDRTFEFEPDDTLTSGAWQLIGYNTGKYDHTIQLIFELDDAPLPPTQNVPITLVDINGAPLSSSQEVQA